MILAAMLAWLSCWLKIRLHHIRLVWFIIPPLHLRRNGGILDSPDVCPSVCPSVRPSVDKVSGTFWKQLLAQFISYLACTLMVWVFWPLFIFVFLASFLALWWPNICPKMWFPELLEKTIGPIHFIPGIYPNGVSLLTPIHFRVPSLIFGLMVAKYLAQNGVFRTFWKKNGSIHFIPGVYPYGVSILTLYIFVFLASFSVPWWPNIWPKIMFPKLFEKLLAHFIPYLVFILMG